MLTKDEKRGTGQSGDGSLIEKDRGRFSVLLIKRTKTGDRLLIAMSCAENQIKRDFI